MIITSCNNKAAVYRQPGYSFSLEFISIMFNFHRENQKQFAIEDFLHDIGAISIISSSSQVR